MGNPIKHLILTSKDRLLGGGFSDFNVVGSDFCVLNSDFCVVGADFSMMSNSCFWPSVFDLSTEMKSFPVSDKSSFNILGFLTSVSTSKT